MNSQLLSESGYRTTVRIGDVVEIEGRCSEQLLPEPWWDKADFRIKVWNDGPITSLAVNVRITGRTVQWRNGAPWVKVAITYPGDCEPDQYASGWLLLKNA